MRLIPVLFLLVAGTGTQAADLTVPPAIKNTFRFGLFYGVAIGFDAGGNAYVAGASDRLVHSASRILGPGGGLDVFVMKVSPVGQKILYLTQIGGSAGESIAAIAVDRTGNVFLAGNTSSADFPTTAGSFQPNSNTGGPFILKLDPTGSKLLYSTYLDQEGTYLSGLAINETGNAYVTGITIGRTFPTTKGAFIEASNAVPTVNVVPALGYGFVSELDAGGAKLLFSTLIGSPKGGVGVGIKAIALDGAGVIHLHGYPQISEGLIGFPTTPGAPYSYEAFSSYHGFLARLNPTMSTLLYSTLLPQPYGSMVADQAGNSYLAWPDQAVKIDTSGAVSYIRSDVGGDNLVVLDDASVILAGRTNDPSFPTLDTLRPCEPNLPHNGTPDSYPPGQERVGVVRLDALGNTTFSTLLGGIGSYRFQAVARSPDGAVFLAGGTGTSGTAAQFPGGPGLIAPDPIVVGAEGNQFVFELDLSAAPHGVLAPSCLANGASYAYAPAAAGMIATLYGSNLGPRAGVQFPLDLNGRVPTELGGTTVTVGSIAAPILYSQDRQINFIVPFEVAGSSTEICVTRAEVQSCIFAFTAKAAPALFGGILNQDGSLNHQHPALAGSVISVFGTGMGSYDRTLVDGAITGPPFANLANPPQAAFTSQCLPAITGFRCTATLTGEVLFAGAAPGVVAGVDQVNIRVPNCVLGSGGQLVGPYQLSLDFGKGGKVVAPIATSCVR